MALGAPPGAALEQRVELRAHRVGEDGEVDLVAVLVLHDAPGEAARVEEVRIEPDLARRRVGRNAAPDVHDDGPGNDVPRERARVQRCGHLQLFGRGAAVEHVLAAGGEGTRNDRERHEGEHDWKK